MRTLKDTIFSINQYAEQIETQKSRVDLDKIMGINAFSLERMAGALDEYEDNEPVGAAECAEDGCTLDHPHGHGHVEEGHGHVEEGAPSNETEHGHAEAEHGHGGVAEHGHSDKKAKNKLKKHDISGVSSVGLTNDTPLNSHEFNKFMHGIIKERKDGLYRTKGVVCLAGEGDTKFIFQGVHDQIQFTPAKEPWGEHECRTSKVVFIGRNLDREFLEEGFAKCAASPEDIEKAEKEKAEKDAKEK